MGQGVAGWPRSLVLRKRCRRSLAGDKACRDEKDWNSLL